MHLDPFTLAPALWGALTLCLAYAAGFLIGRGEHHQPQPPCVLA